jgi:hypothetical protein
MNEGFHHSAPPKTQLEKDNFIEDRINSLDPEQKKKEQEFLENMVNITLPARILRLKNKIKSEPKGYYSKLTGKLKNVRSENENFDHDIWVLNRMLKSGIDQLKIYNGEAKRDKQFESRKNYIALSEGLPSNMSNFELAPENPLIPTYLLNPLAMREVSEYIGPEKGGRKSKKSKKSKISKKSKKSKKSRTSKKSRK